LQIDPKTTILILFVDKRIALARTFSFVHPIEVDGPSPKSAGTKDSGDYAQAPTDYKALWALIRNTIHYFGVQNGRKVLPEKIFYTGAGGGASSSETAEALKRASDLPVELIDPGKDERIQMNDDAARCWDPVTMGDALALALRDTKTGLGFNFRKNGFEKKKRFFAAGKQLRGSVLLLGVLLFFLAANTGTEYYVLKNRHEALDQKITTIFQETFPGKRIPAGKELAFLEAEIDRTRASAVSYPGMNADDGVLSLLIDMSRRIPNATSSRITRMVADPDTVRISGSTDTFNTVDKIKNDLASSALYSAATISSAKLDQTGKQVEFEIKLDRRKR
jgi:hypothetical protein